MPPAVAQAPIVTRSVRHGAQPDDLLGLLRRADRALDEEDVERAGRAARGRLGELDDVEPLGDREQLVLEVEEGQLAAVARGELDDADPRPAWRLGARRRRACRTASPSAGPPGRTRSPSSATEKTGPSRQTKNGPSWQWPHSPTPQAMFRSSVSQVRSAVDAAARERRRGRLHHPLGPADEGGRPRRRPRSPGRRAG